MQVVPCAASVVLLLSLLACGAGVVRGSDGSDEKQQHKQPPHIIFIVADDLGWNDVGFHGSQQIPTPNIDALAYSGLILNNYYVQPICSPSRSAIMTGRHPIHTGLQHSVIFSPSAYGIPLNISLLPQYLQNLRLPTHHNTATPPPQSHPYNTTTPLSSTHATHNAARFHHYATAAVGKWHLGLNSKGYTPTCRGFNSFYGYWTGHMDYYDHTAQIGVSKYVDMWGYDFRRDMEVDHSAYGEYATDLFTSEAVSVIAHHDASRPLFLYLAHLAVHSANSYAPLQAPAEYVDRFRYIEDPDRRTFAAMLAKLDDSIGEVTAALRQRGFLDNSVIVFTTDNGGPAGGFNLNHASNWPMRGTKATLWEGGVRGAGFVWSPLITQPPGTVAHQLIDITDWLPTLYAAAGGDPASLPPSLDGLNQWGTLTRGSQSPRSGLLHNIDPMMNAAALRMGDWKLVYNPQWYDPHWDLWFGPSGRNETAPETALSVLFQAVRDSPAGQAVLDRDPHALDAMAETRTTAMLHCEAPPNNLDDVNHCKSSSDGEKACLFHIPTDPCELHDLSASHPEVVATLRAMLRKYNETAVPPLNRPSEQQANPKYWGYNWNNWRDFPLPRGVPTEAEHSEEGDEDTSPLKHLFDYFNKWTEKKKKVNAM